MDCTHLCAVVWVFDGDIPHRLQSVFALLFDLLAADQLVAVVRIAVGVVRRIRTYCQGVPYTSDWEVQRRQGTQKPRKKWNGPYR